MGYPAKFLRASHDIPFKHRTGRRNPEGTERYIVSLLMNGLIMDERGARGTGEIIRREYRIDI
jgi:hypothetical protein